MVIAGILARRRATIPARPRLGAIVTRATIARACAGITRAVAGAVIRASGTHARRAGVTVEALAFTRLAVADALVRALLVEVGFAAGAARSHRERRGARVAGHIVRS